MQFLSEKWQYVQTIEAYITEQRILLRKYSVHLYMLTKQALILKRCFLKDRILMILLLVFFGNDDYGMSWWQNYSVTRSQTVWKICFEYSMYDKNNLKKVI